MGHWNLLRNPVELDPVELTWLCTSLLQTFPATFSTWHGSAPKASCKPSPEPSTEPVEPDLALHQGFLEPSLEPSPKNPAPKTPGTFSTFSGTFSGTLLKLSVLRGGGGPRLRSDKARFLHGVGAGSWGTRKRCFCSALGFWPFVGFYVDMLGPRFFPLGQPLS